MIFVNKYIINCLLLIVFKGVYIFFNYSFCNIIFLIKNKSWGYIDIYKVVYEYKIYNNVIMF